MTSGRGRFSTAVGAIGRPFDLEDDRAVDEPVEHALKHHPAVWDAIVTGTPHERFGQQVTAVVALLVGGILAIGATVDEPVIVEDQVVPGKRLTVTMSCDHRVIDGALGARWLQAFAELFEKPESLAL